MIAEHRLDGGSLNRIIHQCRRAMTADKPDIISRTLSVHANALDPADAPGACRTAPGGLRFCELRAHLCDLCNRGRLRMLEIVGIDPSRDRNEITSVTMTHLLMAALDAAQNQGD